MTRRRTTLALLAFLLPVATFALAQPATIIPSGKTATESRDVRGFTGVGFSLPGTLVLRQGPAAPLLIEAADNLLAEIETVVEGGTLKIRFKRSIDVRGRAGIQILLTGPDIESLAVSGSGDVVSEALKSRSLKVAISGSGSVRIAKLDTDSLTASLAGSGGFRAAGRATEVVAKLAGSGALDAGRLESSRVRASVAGSADATFWARESLEATIAGSGDVRYYGDPVVTRKTAGSGTLKRLGPAP